MPNIENHNHNSYRRIGDGWGVQLAEGAARIASGTTVPVRLRSGETKQVTLGNYLGMQYGKHFYEVAPQAQRQMTQAAVGDCDGVHALFDRAAAHLKYPKITLSVPANNETIIISRAGPDAKVPFSLNVCSSTLPGRYGKLWYGRILRDGTFETMRPQEPIATRLRALAADPVAVAAEHGRLTGRCCFCNHGLEDDRSTAVGYGPICADHFGLPWGERPGEFAAHPEDTTAAQENEWSDVL